MRKIYVKVIHSFLGILALSLSLNVNGQYCIPAGTNSSYGTNNFTTTGALQNISNTNSGFSTGGYGDFTSLSVVQDPGGSVSFTANFLGSSSTYGFRIWVDWNQNGTFEPSEVVYQSSSYQNSHSGSFTVPLTALPGPTRMRTVSHWLSTTGDVSPCSTSHTYGEFEDYTFEVTGLDECDGTPSAGVITEDENFEICGGVSFTLATTGATLAGEITRQWQKREPNGSNQWEDIVNGTGYGINFPNGVNEETDFRFYIVCNVSGESDTSNVVSATIKPPLECYCVPYNNYSTAYYISGVTTNGALTDLHNVGTGFSTGGYGDYTATDTLRIYPGQQFTITFTHPSSTYGYSLWIDWNQNGSFNDPGDEILASTSYYESPATFTFQVPTSAPITTTRLRVRNGYLTLPAPACGSHDYGEAEDYTIDIVSPPTCLPPLNANLINHSGSTAEIIWTEQNTSSTWNIEYGPVGFVPGSGNGTTLTGITTNPYTITDLDENTSYDIYVQTDCGDEDYSYWTGPVFVHTDCSTFPIPYRETFEDNSGSIYCWANEHVSGSVDWIIGTGSTGGTITTAFEGQKNAIFDANYLNVTKFITPTLNVQNQDSVALVFAYAQQNWLGDQNTMKLYARTEDDNQWVELENYNQDASQWTLDTVIIQLNGNELTGNELKFAFEGKDDFGYAGVIDDVQVFPCSAEPGINGYKDVCRLDGTVDLNTVITPGEDWGRWVFPSNVGLVNGSTFNFTTLPVGAYQVYYIVESPCVIADTTVATISVFNASSAGTGGTLTVCKGHPIQLYSGLSGNVDFGGDWHDGNGNLLNNSHPFAPTTAGTYYYTYYTSNGICPIDSAVVEVIVPEDCNLSVVEQMFEEIIIYPNPASEQLTIENLNSLQDLTIDVSDMSGKVILKKENVIDNTSKTTLRIDQLANGIYTLKIYNVEGQKIFKFIKQ